MLRAAVCFLLWQTYVFTEMGGGSSAGCGVDDRAALPLVTTMTLTWQLCSP